MKIDYKVPQKYLFHNNRTSKFLIIDLNRSISSNMVRKVIKLENRIKISEFTLNDDPFENFNNYKNVLNNG